MSRTGTSAIAWAPLAAYMEEQKKKKEKQKQKEDKHESNTTN